MFCKQCHYNLNGCQGICPECGTRFDPTDSRTFEHANPRMKRLQDDALTLLAVAIIALPLAYGVMVFLRYSNVVTVMVQTPKGPELQERLPQAMTWITAVGGLTSLVTLMGAISCYLLAVRERRLSRIKTSFPSQSSESEIGLDESL